MVTGLAFIATLLAIEVTKGANVAKSIAGAVSPTD
jgi:hypothetical protein